jgi:hypothetical protein
MSHDRMPRQPIFPDVIPAKAGIQCGIRAQHALRISCAPHVSPDWIPACAGMTTKPSDPQRFPSPWTAS